jgi:hypothetical protein
MCPRSLIPGHLAVTGSLPVFQARRTASALPIQMRSDAQHDIDEAECDGERPGGHAERA